MLQVAFPVLESLGITSLPNITDIWDKKLRPAESFCQLKKLDVSSCSKLVNLVQSTMLPQLRNLQTLCLDSCPVVGGVVDLEKREEETQEPSNNTIVPFPELTHMKLGGLENIKGFCTITSEEQPVNHAQVAFPKLESLCLDELGGIVLQQLLGACEPSTKTLVFSECDEISTVVLSRLLRRLRNVDLLVVKSCIGGREVFHFDGLEVGEGQECVGSLIQVRKIELDTLSELTCLWNKDPHGHLCLQNLECLSIKDCPLLRNLLTASVAKALGGLKALYLRSCSTMEEVIATDEGQEEVIDDEEIVFPKLEWLILKDLSNLKSFCSANYNFNLPSLKKVVVKRCPNMQTFTSGSVRMPPTNFITRGYEKGPVIEDLNKHLEQQHLKGDQETIEENEMYGEEDIRFSSLDLYL
ncbi:hypothetical protein RHSIM_Rhsim04G0055600 [Rhododendron simsii]|uniref:Disease resistance protein At4g27190-like leucine-rich repeats domain-containing protein n=1 Tax=Rhododendron simsii TaxID=118357 RepID=A0A834HCR9_RHOSS|nr:hypothetical protein RHSIM_Rhsim04G0055600 [Rhododendron simsii]